MYYLFSSINIINNQFRSFPLDIQLYILLFYLFTNNKNLLYLFITGLISECSVPILKEVIFKMLCNCYKKDYFPLFGNCKRPSGAKGCDSCLNSDKLSTSYGMPSGHAQIMGCITGYIYFYLKYKTELKYKNKKKYNLLIGLLFMLNIYMGYTRVYVTKCHTIGHVILGGLIGLSISYLCFKYFNKK